MQPSEVERGAIKGAVNMPLSSLREKLHDLPNDKKLYVYCQVSRGGWCWHASVVLGFELLHGGRILTTSTHTNCPIDYRLQRLSNAIWYRSSPCAPAQ